MLKHLRIRDFKSLHRIDVELPRLAVLAGPNAAGKSNLLDALQMIARAATARTLTEAAAPPIRGFPIEMFSLPKGGLSEAYRRKRATLSIETDLDLVAVSGNGAPKHARYGLSIAIDPASGRLSIAGEHLLGLTKNWQPRASEKPRIEPTGNELLVRDSARGAPRHEPLGLNHTILSDGRLSGPRYQAFDLVRAEFENWRTYYLDPATAMRAAAPPRDVTGIGAKGEDLAPFLYGLRARRRAEFDAVTRMMRTVIPAIDGLDVDLDTKRGTLDIHITQAGTRFSSRVVSEGTLRVLGLCAIAVTAKRGLVAFEEPENGVQPQRLDHIAALLAWASQRAQAQFVVTTHSPAFVAAILHQARETKASIGVFSVGRSGSTSTITPLPDPGLWEEPAIDELLKEPDRHDRVAALMRRGWLDV